MTDAALAPAAPTPLRIGEAGICRAAGAAKLAMETILAECRTWGMLGLDLEWTLDGTITWVGFGTSTRSVSFWWPDLPEDVQKLARDAMADATLTKLGQNGIQADKRKWEDKIGPTGGVWEDLMLLHHAAYPGIAHDLQQIVAQFLVVPPWKAWRRAAMQQADKERREHVKAEKKAEKQATHQAKNTKLHTDKEAREAEKKAKNDQKLADQQAERDRKAQEKLDKKSTREAEAAERRAEKAAAKIARMAEHEARNAESKRQAEERKAASTTLRPKTLRAEVAARTNPPPGAVVPKASPPAPPPRPRPRDDDDDLPFDGLPANGLLCSVCGEPQRLSPAGETCINQHGGAPGIEPAAEPEPVAAAPPPPAAATARTRLYVGGSVFPPVVCYTTPRGVAGPPKVNKIVLADEEGNETEYVPPSPPEESK